MKHDNKLLEEILQDEECGGTCIASMVFKYIEVGDDMLLQLKMVEKFKYIWSKDEGQDIGNEYAFQRFAKEHAENYRTFWDRGGEFKHVESMYSALISADKLL